MWVGPTADLRSQRSRRTSSTVKAYPTITVGAFAAHCFKFRHGAGILSLQNKLQKKRSLSRVASNVSSNGSDAGDDIDWSIPEIRSQDDIQWQLTTRMDACASQALTAVITSFCRNLELALQHPVDRHFLRIIDSIGFLFQVESLLSTHGKETGMLEDFAASVDTMKKVTIVLDLSPPSHLPSTLNLHLKNTNLPSVVSVRLSRGEVKGTFAFVVGVRCNSEIANAIPPTVRSGGKISVTPIMFTQGINEMQTLANSNAGKKTSLQETINMKSLTALVHYVDMYKKLAAKHVSCSASLNIVPL